MPPGHPSSAERCWLGAIEKMTIQWRAILPLFLGTAIWLIPVPAGLTAGRVD
ncbi:MAG TPA: hypothetical protein VIH18_17990 [Candidatus Binatia bacterium]|jgi:hypothetical protein